MRFLVLFTLVLALFCVIYYDFIQFVDPYGEYDTGTFPVLVLDSRRAKLQLLHRFSEQGAVGGLILGSSRSLLMRPGLLSGDGESRVFNFAVDNAHAEDFLAIYHYALAQGINPKFLVIGLDIASLHSDDAHDHMFDRSELKSYLEHADDTSSWLSIKWLIDAKSVYTKDYLKDSFKAIWMKIRHQTPKTKFAADGYELQYSGAQFPLGEIGPQHDFSDDIKSYMQRIAGMRDLSPKRLDYLRQLFTEARQHNAIVVVWLTPIHPRLNEFMIQNTNYADLIKKVNVEAENWVSAYGIHYEDYSDIRAFGGLETAWDDSSHMNWRNMDCVARALVSEGPHGL
jgi:hypothetical protein